MKSTKTLLATFATLLSLPAAHADGCCASAAKPVCCAQSSAPEKFSDKSLYQTESSWTTDAGKQITLSHLAGKPQVVAMFFASCQFTCPVTVNDMKRIEAALPPDVRSRIGFTLVSFDSRRDQPEVLKKYRGSRGLSESNWTLLHGGPDDVLELSALLGVNFKQDARGDFSHSNLITILNAQGEVVHRLIGLNQDVAETVRLLTTLAAN